MGLTGKQRRQLRALGHHLSPVVLVGQNGITPALISAVKQALADHELIKVKVGASELTRTEVAENLSAETLSQVAQELGKTILLFRQHPKKPKIKLETSKPAKPASKTAEKE